MQRINSPLALYKRTLTAASVIDQNSLINATGSKLFCKAALQPFKVKLDNGESFDFEEGFSYEMAPGDFFKGLELVNPNAAALDVQLYVGNARIFRAAPLYMREAPTSIGSGQSYTIAASGTQLIAKAPTGVHRKHVIITVRTTTAGYVCQLWRTNAAGTPLQLIAEVQPGSSFVMATSDNVMMINPNAGNLLVATCEIIYA